jgi:hypothetical protein
MTAGDPHFLLSALRLCGHYRAQRLAMLYETPMKKATLRMQSGLMGR